MDHPSHLPTLDHLRETGDDLVDDKQIAASAPAPGIVEHRSYFSDPSHNFWDKEQVEQWRWIRELGRGGQGRVHLEEKHFATVSGTGPQLRAVKVLPERDAGVRTMHHLPEILGMAKFSKVCFSALRGD